jgi:hypothetical protein
MCGIFVRLARSMHFEGQAIQGLVNALTRSVLLEKSISNCKSGINGAFYSV